jgi:hypothetical protein
MNIRNSSDLLTALFFLAVGAVVLIYTATHYSLGTPARMGAGLYPMALCIGLIVMGVILMLQALIDPDEAVGTIDIRPVLLLFAATLLFGLLIDRAGLLISAAILVFAARSADRNFALMESAMLAAVLIGITTGLFWYTLGLPFQLLPV